MGGGNSVEAASKKGVCNEGDTCFITTIHLPGAKKPASLPPLVNDLMKWEIYNTTSSEDGLATTVYYRVVVNQEAVLQQQDNKIKQAIALNDEGNEFFKEGKYAEAIEKYKQALDTTSNEDHKKIYEINIEKTENELAKVNQAIALNEEGNELFKEGKYVEAIKKYKQALETTSNENHKVTYRNNIKLSENELAKVNQALEEKHHDAKEKHRDGKEKHHDAKGKHHDDKEKRHDAKGKHHDDKEKHHDAKGKHHDDKEKHHDAKGKHQINTPKIQELQQQELSQLEEEIQKLQLELDELKNVNETGIFEQGIHFYEEIPIDVKYEIEKLYNDSEELRERDYEEEQQRDSMIHSPKFR